MDLKGKTFLKIGADLGLYFGLLFALIFLTAVYGFKMPVLWIVSLAGALAVPVMLFYVLDRTHKEGHRMITFSALWVEGLVIFFCGSLIMSVAVYLFFRWLEPAFMVDMVEQMIEIYKEKGDPESLNMASNLQTVIRGHIIPSPAEIVIEMIWIVVFTGSVLSMAIAGILRAGAFKGKKK